jgi:hypothetical protein
MKFKNFFSFFSSKKIKFVQIYKFALLYIKILQLIYLIIYIITYELPTKIIQY